MANEFTINQLHISKKACMHSSDRSGTSMGVPAAAVAVIVLDLTACTILFAKWPLVSSNDPLMAGATATVGTAMAIPSFGKAYLHVVFFLHWHAQYWYSQLQHCIAIQRSPTSTLDKRSKEHAPGVFALSFRITQVLSLTTSPSPTGSMHEWRPGTSCEN